jgi:hypothetical protein
VSIVAGVLLIVIAASSDGPTSLTNSIPVPVHVLLDLAGAALFIAAPFLFGFSSEGAPTAFFIALGVLYVLVVVGTRYPRQPRAEPLPAEERPLDPDA